MRIPSEVISPIIARHSEASLMDLAERADVNYEMLLKVGTRGNSVSFDFADRILCAMHVPRLWGSPPLDYYYWEGEVPPDKSKPALCENPRCEEWFALDPDVPQRWNRRHCSTACQVAHGRMTRGEKPAPGETIEFKCEFCEELVTVSREQAGGGAQLTRRRACDQLECKKALKASLMKDWRVRQKAVAA